MDARFSSYQQQNGPYSTGSGAGGAGMQGMPGVGGSLAGHGRQVAPGGIGGMHMRGGSSGSVVQPHMQSMGANRIGSQQHYVQGQGSVARGPPPSTGYATSPNVGRSPTSYQQQQQQQQGALGGGYPGGRTGGPSGGFIPPSGDLLSMLNNTGSNGTAGQQQQYPREDGPALSMSDFPSLGGASSTGQQQRSVAQEQGTDAVGVLLGGRGLSQSPTFGEEDFPALPGAPGNRPQRVVQRPPAQSLNVDQSKINAPAVHKAGGMSGVAQPPSPGDRYGLLGLLNVIRMSDPDLTTLALGTDLTTLGLNLNSPEPLWKTFVSPWAEGPSKQEVDPRIPDSYIASSLQMTREHWYHLKPDTLFYIFYGTPGEESQIRAGAELSRRGWMYHKELKSWIMRVPNTKPDQKTDRVEIGSFLVFDVLNWEIIRKDGFTLSLDALESKAKIEEGL
ncbi:hypothetical protein M9434_001239 [Picochlorum sp. BPE23]|nr:hypothetical protein M9434_001239 [Picochlorum sp. BPE23]